jgi:predicted amidohydrolase
VRLTLIQPNLGRDANNSRRMGDAIDAQFTQSGSTGRGATDLLVLPEHWSFEEDPGRYEAEVRELALGYRCHVIGGSHHVVDRGVRFNRGVVVSPTGDVLETYEKLRPYGAERRSVTAGSGYGTFELEGFRVLVLLCADFWFFDLIERAPHVPDLIAVPALSVSRKNAPDYSRRLWQHLAVSRAYELSCYVGVSDWAFESERAPPRASGVAGLADPTTADPDAFFSPVSGGGATFALSLTELTAFRADRLERGFLWRTPSPST